MSPMTMLSPFIGVTLRRPCVDFGDRRSESGVTTSESTHDHLTPNQIHPLSDVYRTYLKYDIDINSTEIQLSPESRRGGECMRQAAPSAAISPLGSGPFSPRSWLCLVASGSTWTWTAVPTTGRQVRQGRQVGCRSGGGGGQPAGEAPAGARRRRQDIPRKTQPL